MREHLKIAGGLIGLSSVLVGGTKLLSSQENFDASEFRLKTEYNRGESSEIYLYDDNLGGITAVNISRNEAADFQPEISSDGTRMIFGSRRDGIFELYIMDFNRMELVRVTNTTDHEYEPTFSPDGDRVAFLSVSVGDYKREVYVMDINGTNVRKITDNMAYEYNLDWRTVFKINFESCILQSWYGSCDPNSPRVAVAPPRT
ncbi:hypothetical protein A2803_00400 [Candidatus Woesebacteria bacterium RIFCSPHIGHO2_01_FULL_44_21]|uniref:DUF5050 domain-containing protein n=1 Tax=Candidatus Woesebacteria bacterium RIFCSPHIGHO2_01_FULL_44_21 TaxID=1802503 RepID=A0A1F7YY00_9BACT|nr:MAG: hypothetical protein A2803_00400 [Candidatus Woesebacteria bacterium RIFCSPHIGHO2_01_FULL_44_21]OGM68930.1 MAG: hypothetical protein A2897_02095 [Candidatus Woesebacteria bacterium RIFCSPLOWO2_01_FULL_44_24b]